MRKWIFILLWIALVLPLWAQAQNRQDVPPLAQQIAEKIQTAIQNYKDDKVPEGAALLCDIVLMARPRTSWPEDFPAAMDSARNFFQKGQFAEGVGHVQQAIKLFKPDYTPSAEKHAGSLAAIGQLVLNKIESATEEFKAGDANQAVLLILESLALLSPSR